MGEVRLVEVAKSFGSAHVVKGVDLEIPDGDFAVFVGPSGCGKSTLLRMIAGLESASSGRIEIGGRKVDDLPPVERGVAMVFQSYALYPHMSVYENIAFPLRVARMAEAEIDRRVKSAAETLQLTARLGHRPAALSGGQRQRVAIGRAIVRQPQVFLFDEPLSNLDAALRGEMRLELTRLHKELGATMIYVTHDQVEAMTMADRIVVLNAGRVEQVGGPLELYHHPRNLFVAGFIGNPKMNFLPAESLGRAEGGLRVRLFDGAELVVPVEGEAAASSPLILGVRPEHLRIDPAGSLTMQAEVVERLGAASVAYGLAAHGEQLRLQTSGDAPIQPGERLALALDPALCHVFDAQGEALKRRS